MQGVFVAAVYSRLVVATGQGSLCAVLSVMPFPSTSTIDASNVTLLATQCNISASGDNAVGSVAFAAFSNIATSITVVNVAVYAYQSTITTTGYLVLSSVGVAARSKTYFSQIMATNVTLLAVGCNISVFSSTAQCVSSVGFATNSDYDTCLVTATNVLMYTKASEISTVGKYSVSSLAITAHSSFNSIYITLNNVSIYAAESNITTAGSYSSSVMGAAAYASQLSSIDATILTIQAVKCNIASSGTVTSMGFTGESVLLTSSRVVIACCDSTVSTTGVGVAGVACSRGTNARTTQWLLVRSQITATNACVNMRPSMGVSVASQLVAQCAPMGWVATSPSPYCSNNATWAVPPPHHVSSGRRVPLSQCIVSRSASSTSPSPTSPR